MLLIKYKSKQSASTQNYNSIQTQSTKHIDIVRFGSRQKRRRTYTTSTQAKMMIKNTTLSFLVLTGMLGGSSAISCRGLSSQRCESEPRCVFIGGNCFLHPNLTGPAAEGEALLSLEAAADDPNYDHHGHKRLRGGQLAKGAVRLDSREYNGDIVSLPRIVDLDWLINCVDKCAAIINNEARTQCLNHCHHI